MAISDGQDARNDLIEAIAEFGTSLTVLREARTLNGIPKKASSRTLVFIPLLEASAIYPSMVSPLGLSNQGDISNHDVFYCHPDTDIVAVTDSIVFEGVSRTVTKVRTPVISGINVVRAVYVLKDSQN